MKIHSMIGTFQAILKHGYIMTSRFTGYPVAEFGMVFYLIILEVVVNFVTFILTIYFTYIYFTFNLDDKERKIYYLYFYYYV